MAVRKCRRKCRRKRRRLLSGIAIGASIAVAAFVLVRPILRRTARLGAFVGVRSRGCGQVGNGSAVFIDVDRALTAAHVVAGSNSVVVFVDGVEQRAIVSSIDTQNDIALLVVGGRKHKSVKPQKQPLSAKQASAFTMRRKQIHREPVTITRRISIATTDIFNEKRVRRPGLELAGDVIHGDSGGAVAVNGKLIGLIWARSRSSGGRAYAIEITVDSVKHLETALQRGSGTKCAAGAFV